MQKVYKIFAHVKKKQYLCTRFKKKNIITIRYISQKYYIFAPRFTKTAQNYKKLFI